MEKKIDDGVVSDFLLGPRCRLYRHLLLQLVVLLITVNVLWYEPLQSLTILHRLLGWVIYWATIDFVIYTNIYWLVPRFLQKNRLGLYLLTVLGVIFLAILITVVYQDILYASAMPSQYPGSFAMFVNAFSGILTIGFITAGTAAIMLFRHWILFKLEDLLRYQMNDSSRENVSLSSDIRFLNDYLNLGKIRRDKFEYTLIQEGDIDSVWLPPLLFIPFVENAVKHNSDSENPSYVHVSFKVCDAHLEFQCENSKPVIVKEKGRVGGIGLANIRRRLTLLYPGHYLLERKETKENYTVILYLDL